MNFEFVYDPVPLIIIRNVFTKIENKEILEEAVKNKKKFTDAAVFAGTQKDFRSNKVAYYDNIYLEDRTKSKLLSGIDKIFSDQMIQDVLASSEYPIHMFDQTNYHETQVSRYGDAGQKYDYHIDVMGGNSTRIMTIVYYFNEEPKKYSGGEISFTNSPIYKGKKMDKNAKEYTVTPENNMAVIFGGRTSHAVKPTKSPKTFNKGRFSVNCWIGRR